MSAIVTPPRVALLRDGSTVVIRPITPGDAERHVRFFEGIGADSKRLRFFAPHPHLSADEVTYFTRVDGVDRVALIALRNDATIGVGRFDRVAAGAAEVAFLVTDAVQGLGVGSLLLDALIAEAHRLGYTTLVARTLAENTVMRAVFAASRLPMSASTSRGEVSITLDLTDLRAWRVAAAGRDASTVVESLRHILDPVSVAVVGAGRSPASVGHQIVVNLRAGGFAGAIVPVNRHADAEIAGLPAVRSVAECAAPPDLAVIAVPAAEVPAAVEECGHAGVRGLVIVSAGFAEVGEAGRILQDDVLRRAHDAGMRVVGPNCIGVINMPRHLNATFAGTAPRRGSVGFASQSGGMGIALLERAAALQIGLSSFISLGNRADVSSNDLLQYWEQDQDTKVGLLYLESMGNARAFLRIASRVSRRLPLVALKSGWTPAGERAAQSHTSAAATPDVVVDALFDRAGVIRVRTLEELLDTAALLSTGRLPRAEGVAVISNAGGAGILAADACAAARLPSAPLSAEQRRSLEELGLHADFPLDLGAGASPARFRDAVSIATASPDCGAVVVIVAPLAGLTADAVIAALEPQAMATDAPILLVTLGMETAAGRRIGGAVTRFSFPENAITALGHAVDYLRWLRRDIGEPMGRGDVDLDGAHALIGAALAGSPEGRWLSATEVDAVLRAYGVATVPQRLCATADEAVRAARAVGYPVALKAQGARLLHKSDRGGVVLGIRSAARLRTEVERMRAALGGDLEALLVQRMLTDPSVEAIVGGINDASLGPLVMAGAGGTLANLLGDTHFAPAPLGERHAADLVAATRLSALLDGYRGGPRLARAALVETVDRIAQLLADRPEIAEMDCNPVIVTPDAAVVADARIRVRPASPGDDVRGLD